MTIAKSLALVGLLAALGGCSTRPSTADMFDIQLRTAAPNETPVIVQWKVSLHLNEMNDDELRSLPGLAPYSEAMDTVGGSGASYFEDASGDGLYSIHIFTDRVDETVANVIRLDKERRLPPGARIGVARSKDANGLGSDYRPVYPEGLERIDGTPADSVPIEKKP